MSRKYSDNEIDNIVKREIIGKKNISKFYKHKIVNYKGKFQGVFYSEIIARRLLDLRVGKLTKNINEISRKKSYHAHQGVIAIRNTKRHEENFAKELFNKRSQIGCLGRVVECQVPLKDIQENSAGKIDLVSVCDSGILYLIELKYGKNRETLLRAVLEIVIYYRQLDKEKLISDFSDEFMSLSVNRINKAVLLGNGTQAYDEAADLANRPYLDRLIKTLKVEVVFADTFKKL